MAITSGFFNSLEGDRKYDARQMGEMFDGLIMDGVFMSIGDALKTTPSSGMTVAVGTGRAWFLHTWTKNDSEYLIEVSAAESVLNRIDTIVLDVDNTEAVRSNTIKLIKGTPASNAKRQTLINTTDHKQIPLADILVPAGATELSTTNITNIVGTSECPYVTGPLSIISNDDILAAWQEEFDTWFEGVKGALGDDTAGNLYNLIQQKVDKTSVLDTMDEVNLTTEKGLVAGALAVKELNSKMFMCEFRQFETVEGDTWVATPSGVTKTLDQPVSSYRLIGFLCISEGTDGRTHRQIQWFPSVWLQQIANGSNAANKTIIFNLSRGNSDRRVFIELVQNNPNKYRWLKLSNDGDRYSLVVFGLK